MRFIHFSLGTMGLVLSTCLSSTTNGEMRMIFRYTVTNAPKHDT